MIISGRFHYDSVFILSSYLHNALHDFFRFQWLDFELVLIYRYRVLLCMILLFSIHRRAKNRIGKTKYTPEISFTV